MRRSDVAVVVALLVAAFALRFAGLERPPFRWMDENAHIPAAVHYWNAGQFEPDFWEHPPLRHLLAYGFLRAFGDDPYGWRMRNVLFGAAAAALTWLFAFQVTGRRTVALLAGALVATDPLHVVMSRFTFEEIYGGTFFLASVVVYLAGGRRTGPLLASALLMGCALATKWYYVPAWLVMLVLALREEHRRRDAREALLATTAWVLVPLGVYLASYWPWFGRGYGVLDFPELVIDSYHSLQAMTEQSVHLTDTRTPLTHHLSAAEWFVRPLVTGTGTLVGGDRGAFILYGNDLPVWILALPAIVVTAARAVRGRELRTGLPALLFVASYALFVLVRRPAFLYSAIPMLPFAFTAIAQALSLAAERIGRRLFWAAGAVMVAWTLYLYPLATGAEVPLAPYRAVLDRAKLELR